MFRRLFISLLILSTLSSEGVANFSVNLYKIYRAEVNKLNTSIDSEKKFQSFLQKDVNGQLLMESFLSGTRGSLFVLSGNSSLMFLNYKPVEPKYIHSNYVVESLPVLKESLRGYFDIVDSNKPESKEFIISKSDSSPPYISL